MQELSLNGKEQLYYQVYNILFQDIMSGKYQIGDKIPAESELMETFHVSRATARRAMEMLANEGLVVKKQGQGTTVISNQTRNSLKRVVRYTKKQDLDHVVTVKKMVEQTTVPADEKIAKKLALPTGRELIKLKRVRYADEEPFYCEVNYFEKEYVPEVLERDFSVESLRVFLVETYHIRWSCANQNVYAILADQEMAELLQVAEGSPLIAIERVSYDDKSVPREYVVTYYRGDKYHLEIDLAM